MKLSDFIDALKEFFLDIIGYLVPGFFGILVLSICILPEYKFNASEIGLDKEWYVFVVVIISYVSGYFFYSLSDFTDKIIFNLKFLKLKSVSQLEADIEESQEFSMTKAALKEILLKKDNSLLIDESSLDSMKARNMRSLVMSYIPEADTKIYTFMFRSELCRIISAFSLLVSLLGLFLALVSKLTHAPIIFKNDFHSIQLYIILLFATYFLTKTRLRFLSIAYKIPFLIFIAKYFKIK